MSETIDANQDTEASIKSVVACYNDAVRSNDAEMFQRAFHPTATVAHFAPEDPGGWPEANDGVQFHVHRDPDGPAVRSPGRRRATARRRCGAGRVRQRARAPRAASRREATRASSRAPEPAPEPRATHSAGTNPERPKLRSTSKFGLVCSHEPVDLPGTVSRANQAMAFARIRCACPRHELDHHFGVHHPPNTMVRCAQIWMRSISSSEISSSKRL